MAASRYSPNAGRVKIEPVLEIVVTFTDPPIFAVIHSEVSIPMILKCGAETTLEASPKIVLVSD